MTGQAVGAPIRAAEYLRKSTQHQKYSIENQADAIRLYAAKRGIQVVRTYADRKSGVLFDKRHGLRQLIEDVLTGRADFETILVYDVTRWGRFQDPDENAYYEYICKRAKIKVHYCAEQFENDDTSFAAVVKSIKRAMAGEYSRELSIKSFAGMVRLFRLGFRLGSWAPYGIRRLLVDQNGVPKGVLRHGERKSIQTDRILLVPGRPEEIRTVRWIFSAFVKQRKTEMEIVDILNARGVDTGLGWPWTYHRVRKMLRREIYISASTCGTAPRPYSDRSSAFPTRQKNGCAMNAASNASSIVSYSRAPKRSSASAGSLLPTNRN
jgi:DNA invertase Pin-like site-specific DNA recombinase